MSNDPVIHSLGTFGITSGRAMLSDPCYQFGTWCQIEVDLVANGTWHAYLKHIEEGVWGDRCAALLVRHDNGELLQPTVEDFAEPIDEDLPGVDADAPGPGQRVMLRGQVGVDSGQAGVFDHIGYRNDKMIIEDPAWNRGDEDNEPGERFYGACCDKTIPPENEWDVMSREVFDAKRYIEIYDNAAAVAKDVEEEQDGPESEEQLAAVAKFRKQFLEGWERRLEVAQAYLDTHEKPRRPWGGIVSTIGAVCSSGYGDGGYPAYVTRNENGEAVEFLIVFIGEGEDEE